MTEFTRAQKRACIERELRQRRRVFPRLTAAGKMTDGFAAVQIALMEDILKDYDPDFDELRAQGEMNL